MQTFLSESTLFQSVEVIDSLRLNKQYLEGSQILYAISITPEGGGSRVDGVVPFASNHPVTNMYRGYEHLLEGYLACVKIVLLDRGIKVDVLEEKIERLMVENNWRSGFGLPYWYTDDVVRSKIMASHRHALFVKNPEHYAQYEQDATAFREALVHDLHSVVCCPSKVRKGSHQPYYYPTHVR